MTATIRLPERLQVADALSGDEAFPGDVRQRTDESAAVRTNERNGGCDESSNQFPAVARDLTSLTVYSASREGEHRSAGVVRQAVELFAAALASRFEVGGRKESCLTCARWGRLQRSDVVGGAIRSASGFDTEWLTVRATTDPMAGEKPALRVAHVLVAVELQTSRRGVNEFEH
jgi:hypothetical protein